MNPLNQLVKTVFALILVIFSINVSAAWPERNITLIVPFPPGGNTDLVARLLANNLSTSLGKSVIVENRPGAGSMIGSQAVARAKPDGYTFLVGTLANVLTHYTYKKPLIDIRTDLITVSQVINVPNYISVNNKSDYKNFDDLYKFAKNNPGKLTCANSGVGTSPYITCEMIKNLGKVDFLTVPFKGGAAAMLSVMAGETTFVTVNEALPYINDGRLKGLAVTTIQRASPVPNLPAISETIPGFDLSSWYGIFAPSGTPLEIINEMSSKVASALKVPDVRKALDSLGATPVGSSPVEFSNFVNFEIKRWETILKPINLSLE